MNLLINPDSASSDVPESQASPGKMLRTAREAKGMHLALLSVTLKVPTRQLEALENDQYDAFKGAAFVRAVAHSMCRHLGIDPAPVLAGLPQTSTSMSVQPYAVEAAAKTPLRVSRAFRGPLVSRQVLVLACLMLAGSAALIWWPAPGESADDVMATVQMPAADASAAEQAVIVNVPSVPESSASGTGTEVANVAGASSFPAGKDTSTGGANSSQGGRKNDLLIAASADTWMEIRDAKGQLVLNRLLKAGESMSVDVPAPFNVVIGRAHAVKVTLGGKDFDLTPYTKVSTARFDIQP